MSDISNFVRRTRENNHDEINKILSIINPMAFAEPEDDALKERDILADQVKRRVSSFEEGAVQKDSTTYNRSSTSITILPDTAVASVIPQTPSLTGTLTFPNKKYGAGALFEGTQYISIPDDNQFDLTVPYFTVAFWFKGDGVNNGIQTVWTKGDFTFDQDYFASGNNFDTDDYSTDNSTPNTPGLQVKIEANPEADYTTTDDFDAAFDSSTSAGKVRVIMSDGTNTLNSTVDTSTIFDGNWHSIIIVSSDPIGDYCSACGDYDSDYSGISTPIITVYFDKVSAGTLDHSALTGDLSNSEVAVLGAENTSLDSPLKGNLALFEYQGINWESSDITDYHDNARIRVTNQKVAFHFTGNDATEDTLQNIY